MPELKVLHDVCADGRVATLVAAGWPGQGDDWLYRRILPRTGPRDDTISWGASFWFAGDRVPTDRQVARDWLMARERPVRAALFALSDAIEAAPEDPDPPRTLMYRHEAGPDLPAGVRLRISATTVRGHGPEPFPDVLRAFAPGWCALLAALAVEPPVG